MNEWWPCKADEVQFAYTAIGMGQSDVSGELYEDVTWSGNVKVNGDITVPGNITLTIAKGTEIHFTANTDVTGSGKDTTRSELIVKGTLDADAGDITFRSANDTPSNADWYGIRVVGAGDATLADAMIQDGSRCVQDEGKNATLTMTNTTLSNCGTTVTLSPTTSYAEQKITATLTPASGLTAVKWQWQRRRSADGWTNIASEKNATYTPTTADIGSQLRATVRYQAETGVYPHAQSAATLPVAGLPGALDVMASPEDGQVVLMWDAAAANGAPIKRYEVRWRVARSGHDWPDWSAVPGDGSVLNTTITELLNGTEYEFAVRAVNRVGAGAAASATATPAGVPDAPVLDALERNGRVSLIIRLGADNGSEITRTETRVYSVSKSDTTWRTTPAGQWDRDVIDQTWAPYPTLFTSGQSVGWNGLTNGRTYQFEVRSVNGVGPSAIALTEATPGQTTRPTGALLPLTAWGEDGQVRLEWMPEPFWKVTRYEVQSRVARSGHGWPGWSAVAGGGSARDTTITGLLNGTEYEFMARAVNLKGEPLAVSNLVLATPAGRPGEPVLTASGGDGQVALSWTAASSNGSAIVRYEMQGRVANSGHGWPGWSAVVGGGSARDTTVVGLLNGTEYEFMVRAVNSVGASVAASVSATPEGPPLFSAERVSYSVQAGSTVENTLPAAAGADSYETAGTLPGYVEVNTTTRAITMRPENTHVGKAEFIWRARNPHGTADLPVNLTVTSLAATEYAYRASQTAPLFDAAASGTPDHWSSGVLTWTDAAPRVWRIGRTRPAGGTWSAWGHLDTYSERPAAAATFYQRAQSAPATPATQTGTTVATPSRWQTTPQTATDTQGVWTTTANRAQGEIPWIFTAPVQQTPPRIVFAPGPPRHFTAVSGSPLTPGSIDLDWDWPTSGGAPTGYRVEYRLASGRWLSGATPTLTNASLVLSRAGTLYQFRVCAENSVGTSRWVETTGMTSKQEPTETETAFRLHTSGTSAPSFSASASGVPSGWSSSRRTPNPHARYEWQISRTRPADGSWSSWGSATVVSKYTEHQTAFRLHTSGTSAPAFSASASGVPSGWSSSRRTPNPHARYEWQISRSRPADGSWSSWGSATVVSRYTERQTAFRLHTSGASAPAFSASASGVPSGWLSSRRTTNPHARYEWQISRSRPADGSWSSWGSATVVSRYTERQTAYRLHTSGTTAPSFSASASTVPTGWFASRRTPNPHAHYEWQISRTRPADGAWSSWGSATVVSRYTERQTAFRLHTSGTSAPAFSASASTVPTGWFSSRRTPNPHERYEWQISRTRPADGSWSSWGSATVVYRYTERQTAFRLHTSGTTAPSFIASASTVPTGWSSSRRTPNPHARYEWQISRTRPADGSWSSWGSATVVSRYTERQTAFRLHTSGTSAPAFSASASGIPSGWSSSRRTTNPHARYEWQISRSRPAGESWSSWGSATVVSKYTERQTAFRLHTSGTSAPAFSASASTVPTGWFSSRQTPNPHARYEWQISRSRPAGESWSSWGSATVVSTYTARQTTYRWNNSGTTFPATIGANAESLTSKVKRRLAMAPRHSPEFRHVLDGPWIAERPKPIWDNMDGARHRWR